MEAPPRQVNNKLMKVPYIIHHLPCYIKGLQQDAAPLTPFDTVSSISDEIHLPAAVKMVIDEHSYTGKYS